MRLNLQDKISISQNNNVYFGNKSILMKGSRLKTSAQTERLLIDAEQKLTKEQVKSMEKFLKRSQKGSSALKEIFYHAKFELKRILASLFIN